MAPRKKNPAIQKSGVTSSKAAPLPDWVKGGGPKPPPKYAKGASGASGAGAGAGTSTGAAGAGAGQGSAQPQQQQQQHLWGPGVKTPLNILYERCQKLPGWEKPSVEPVSSDVVSGSSMLLACGAFYRVCNGAE